MYIKKGYPKKEELVLCTVKNLQMHSAMMALDEYENKEGMLHSNELHRRWLRDWKSVLKLGAKHVCKVVWVDEARGVIDLSIKRVGEGQRRNKLASVKNEKSADDLLQFFAKENKLTAGEIYDKIGNKLLDEYGQLHSVFLEVARGNESLLTDAGVDKKLASGLIELIKKRIIIPKASTEGMLSITSTAPDGIGRIKAALEKAVETAKKSDADLKLQYLGAPRFKFRLTADNNKAVERAYEKVKTAVEDYAKKNDADVEFKV